MFVSHDDLSVRNRYMLDLIQWRLILEFIRQRNWSIEFLFEDTISDAALTTEYMNEINREI